MGRGGTSTTFKQWRGGWHLSERIPQPKTSIREKPEMKLNCILRSTVRQSLSQRPCFGTISVYIEARHRRCGYTAWARFRARANGRGLGVLCPGMGIN